MIYCTIVLFNDVGMNGQGNLELNHYCRNLYMNEAAGISSFNLFELGDT